jgi:hypothetical protein
MKKLIYSVLAVAMLSMLNMTDVKAAETRPVTTPAEAPIPEEIQVLINRVYEIKEMDRSELSVTERKELRKELRTIKSELKAVQGIYLSIGAILIIILLLILIL